METLNGLAEQVGINGLELTPGNFWHVRELLRSDPGTARRAGRGVMRLHQSFVGTNPLPASSHERREDYRRGSLATRALMRTVFSGGEVSRNRMAAIRAKLDRDVPAIVYPDVFGDKDADRRVAKRFPGAAVQLNADVLAAWDAHGPEEVAEELSERGVTAVLGSVNANRAGKSSTRNMSLAEYAEPLLRAGLVSGVRVEVFRDDFEKVDPPRYQASITEGRALQSNGSLERTPMGDLFGLLCDAGWQGDIAVVASPRGLQEAQDTSLTLRDVVDIYGAMASTVRSHLPHINHWEAFPTFAEV